MFRFLGPFKQPTHGVEKIPCLRWRCGAVIARFD
jgi:hypothetical protein